MAHTNQFTLCELWSRIYTMQLHLRIFSLQYSTERICAPIGDISTTPCVLYFKFGDKYIAHPPVYAMWTVVTDIYKVLTAPHIQASQFSCRQLTCDWCYLDNSMRLILQSLCQIQRTFSGLRYVNCGPGHIQGNYCSAYSGLNIQLNISALLLEISRICKARHTANVVPNTAHTIPFRLCELWFRPYTMKWQPRIFSLQYSTERICAAVGDISTIQWALYCNLGAKYSAYPPVYTMWTVVPAIYKVLTAPHIHASILSCKQLTCYWCYLDNSMRLILHSWCQIQRTSSGLRYVIYGPGHIQWNYCSAYSGLNIQLNISALLLEISRICKARHTANVVPNTAHTIPFRLCELWFRPYTMKWQPRIFSLQYSTERICAAVGDISTIQWALYCNLGAKYSAYPPVYTMWTVVPAIYNAFTAPYIQTWIFSCRYLRCYCIYHINSMRAIQQTLSQIQRITSRLRYVNCGLGHIQSIFRTAYLGFNIQLKVAPRQFQVSERFNGRYTANLVPNTAHILQLSLCELWSRPYTMHLLLRIFRLKYSAVGICDAIVFITSIQCALYSKLWAKYSAYPPVYAMWTVAPDIYNAFTAPHIQTSMFIWTYLSCYWRYLDNSIVVYCKHGAKYRAHPPVYSMWTVVPDIYNSFSAPHIQTSILIWTYLRCYWKYLDNSMLVILQTCCQIQRTSSSLWYVNCGPGHIQSTYSPAYLGLNIQL
jgi:hypothetical protein